MVKQKTFKNKNAQAALEFLVTYGWAILSVLVVVSALAYFGIFNTSKYVNDVCEFGDQMNCEDYIIFTNATLEFKLRNNLGVAIDITDVSIKSGYGAVSCDPATSVVPNSVIQPGSTFIVACRITSRTLSTSEKITVRPIIVFRKTGLGNPLHNQTGNIFLGVNP